MVELEEVQRVRVMKEIEDAIMRLEINLVPGKLPGTHKDDHR